MKNDYNHYKWKSRRLEILDRDLHRCTNCGNESLIMHVHHLQYGDTLWDVPDEWLITLCEDCHADVHNKPRRARCEICDKRDAQFIVAKGMSGYWRLECEECEEYSSYWIGVEDFKNNMESRWLPHLCRKTWFVPQFFMITAACLMDNPKKQLELMNNAIIRDKQAMDEVGQLLSKCGVLV